MLKHKLLFIRRTERVLSFARLLVIVGGFAGAGSLALTVLSPHMNELTTGALSLSSAETTQLIFAAILMVLAIVAFASRKWLEQMRRNIDSQIDNFEDMTEYSRRRHKKVGELDDDGTLVLSLKLKRGSDDPDSDVEKLIGLSNIKGEIAKMKAVFEYEKKIKGSKGNNVCRHYAFLGNPGTGKTTVARIFAGLLYQHGRIKKNMYLECTGNDLTGEHAGQTKIKVDSIYRMAKGGVLFIDEAYSLCQSGSGMAEEAISQLLVHMESDPYTVLIFAGYTDNMKEFMDMNPGLTSRISQKIDFPNYSPEELFSILKKFADGKSMVMSEDAKSALIAVFYSKLSLVHAGQKDFSNGRYARNCFDAIYQQHAINSMSNLKSSAKQGLNVITLQDIKDVTDELMKLN